MKKVLFLLIGVFFLLCPFFLPLNAHESLKRKNAHAAEILHQLKSLKEHKRVLYIAAHPDDENTRLITYFAQKEQYPTAYISLTRGDGGQNLIGSQKGDALGIIRTHELLGARYIDGGEQYFSGALDFGYSKNEKETFRIWDKEEVLSDLVYVIRKFKPDVCVTRFPPDEKAGHGHHTASTLLAIEAFEKAANPKAFPEQLEEVEVWQSKRLVWNTSPWFFRRFGEEVNMDDFDEIDIGTFLPLKGRSVTEIGALSRSQHKSQGFGAEQTMGITPEYFQLLEGASYEDDIMEGVERHWRDLPNGKKIERIYEKIMDDFNPQAPDESLDQLLKLYELLAEHRDNFYLEEKRKVCQKIISDCIGLYVEATTGQPTGVRGEPIEINVKKVVRSSKADVKLLEVKLNEHSMEKNLAIEANKVYDKSFQWEIPKNQPIDHAFWLRRPAKSRGMYDIRKQSLRVQASEHPHLVSWTFEVNGQLLQFDWPLVYKEIDPAKGEVYEPFYVIPEYTVNWESKILIMELGKSKRVDMKVRKNTPSATGSCVITPKIPRNWRCEPASLTVRFREGDPVERRISFVLMPADTIRETFDLKVRLAPEREGLVENGRTTSWLDFDHLPKLGYFPEAVVKVMHHPLRTFGEHVAYVEGAGDEIPAALERMGYRVSHITNENIDRILAERPQAIVLGVRAFNVNRDLVDFYPKILKYVERGGNLIVQYNTSMNLLTQNVAPAELRISRDRVTDHEARVRRLDPSHRLWQRPNRIIGRDFNGWVQERGLYFPDAWDEPLTPLVNMADPGEKRLSGGILHMPHGRGNYFYTSLSWFRQLPAGVPGAYRIFANMIAMRMN